MAALAIILMALGMVLWPQMWIRLPGGDILGIETGVRNNADGILYVRSEITNRAILDQFEYELRNSSVHWKSRTLGRIRGPLIISFSRESHPLCLYYEADLKGYTTREIERISNGVYMISERGGLLSGIVAPVLKGGDLHAVVAGKWLKIKDLPNQIEPDEKINVFGE